MIGKLKGKIDTIGEEECLIDINGVVYLVYCGIKTLGRMNLGEVICLHIETYVRQDMIKMFGFLTEEERAWFVKLQAIQGVGAKSALSILDVLSPVYLIEAAEMDDIAQIVKAQGIGKKIAQRIITELKGKGSPKMRGFSKEESLTSHSSDLQMTDKKEIEENNKTSYQIRKDTISALVNLGFHESQVRTVLTDLLSGKHEDVDFKPESVDDLIKAALKELA